MNNFSKLLAAAGLVFGLAASASANSIVWTLENVDFVGGETASGTFTTDGTADTLEGFNISVTGGFPLADFTASHGDGFFLPSLVGFFSNSGLVQLYFASDLTSTGGIVPISGGLDDLLALSSHDAEVVGVVSPSATPEPSSIPFLAGALLLMGFLLRRKLIRAN